jgi:hypothetical protein
MCKCANWGREYKNEIISEGHQQLDFLATEIFTYLEHEKGKG